MSSKGVLYACDIETTGLDRFKDRIIGVGVYSPDTSHFFSELGAFKQWLGENPDAHFVFHRGAFDVNFLLHHDIDLRQRFAYDTRSLASILVPTPPQTEGEKHVLSLQNLGVGLLGILPWKLNRDGMAEYSLAEVEAYCLKDCEVTYKLFEYMVRAIPEKSWEFVESWLMPATRFCAQLEYDGVHIDQEGLRIYQAEVQVRRDLLLAELSKLAQRAIEFYHEMQVKEVSKQYKEMYEKAKIKAKDQGKCLRRYALLESAAISRLEPYNWASSTQVAWLLRDYYQLNIYSDREEKETTGEAMLKTLDHPVAKKLLEFREVDKLANTCIPQILESVAPDGKVHPTFDVCGTRTGRLSSSKPNFQNIPKGKIRSFITAVPCLK
jgi:DNA polymerase I-like protein with 3'-5' exonuclease and polymerase domains